MPRAGLGDGSSYPVLTKPQRLTHAEHLQRCLDKMPKEWRYDSTDKHQLYPKDWTPGDVSAWKRECRRAEAEDFLWTQVKRGNVKAMELYFRLLGTPETRPGTGVQVNFNKQTNNNSFRFVVEEVTAGGVQRLLNSRSEQTNTNNQSQVVDGEAREVEEEATREEEVREEEDTKVVEVGAEV